MYLLVRYSGNLIPPLSVEVGRFGQLLFHLTLSESCECQPGQSILVRSHLRTTRRWLRSLACSALSVKKSGRFVSWVATALLLQASSRVRMVVKALQNQIDSLTKKDIDAACVKTDDAQAERKGALHPHARTGLASRNLWCPTERLCIRMTH